VQRRQTVTVAAMSRLRLLSSDELTPDQQDLYAAILRRRAASAQGSQMANQDGSLRGPFNVLLHSPSLGRLVSDLGEAVRFDTQFTSREREIVTLAVAAWRNSEFELYAHTRLGKAAGLSDAEVAAACDREHNGFTDQTERQLLAFAAESLDGHLTDETYDQTVERCGVDKVVQLSILIGYYEMLARVLDVFAVRAGPGGEKSTA